MKATAIFCVFLTFGDLVNIFKSPVVFKVFTLKTAMLRAHKFKTLFRSALVQNKKRERTPALLKSPLFGREFPGIFELTHQNRYNKTSTFL